MVATVTLRLRRVARRSTRRNLSRGRRRYEAETYAVADERVTPTEEAFSVRAFCEIMARKGKAASRDKKKQFIVENVDE